MKKFAFTLAEVLITLGIIGIVAAMTIPTLMNSNNEAQTRTGVKEAYAILSQAMTMAASDNGGTIKGLCADWNNICFKNLIKPALNYTKECDNTPVTDGCWATVKNYDNSAYNTNGYPAIMLKNGMLVLFRFHTQNCTFVDATSTNYKCGWVMVDINGLKNPNVIGKDTFYFHAQDGKFLPAGIDGDTGNFLNCTGSETGA